MNGKVIYIWSSWPALYSPHKLTDQAPHATATTLIKINL